MKDRKYLRGWKMLKVDRFPAFWKWCWMFQYLNVLKFKEIKLIKKKKNCWNLMSVMILTNLLFFTREVEVPCNFGAGAWRCMVWCGCCGILLFWCTCSNSQRTIIYRAHRWLDRKWSMHWFWLPGNFFLFNQTPISCAC